MVFNSIIESICFIFTVLREFLFFSLRFFDSLKMFHLFAGTVASFESVSVPISASYQSQTKLFFFSPGNPVSFSWFVIYLVILSYILNILNIEMRRSEILLFFSSITSFVLVANFLGWACITNSVSCLCRYIEGLEM